MNPFKVGSRAYQLVEEKGVNNDTFNKILSAPKYYGSQAVMIVDRLIAVNNYSRNGFIKVDANTVSRINLADVRRNLLQASSNNPNAINWLRENKEQIDEVFHYLSSTEEQRLHDLWRE